MMPLWKIMYKNYIHFGLRTMGKANEKDVSCVIRKKMMVLVVNKSISDHDLDAYRELSMQKG